MAKKRRKYTKFQQRALCQENNGEKLLISLENNCNENEKLVLNQFSSQSSDLNHEILLGCQNLVFLKACISMFSGKSICQQVSFNFISSSTSNKDEKNGMNQLMSVRQAGERQEDCVTLRFPAYPQAAAFNQGVGPNPCWGETARSKRILIIIIKKNYQRLNCAWRTLNLGCDIKS